ncbi:MULTISPECIES: FKBP-type peptidyl-prolyl cis-trans isomerase [unclassified Microbacterium]|uniref:FKBP-type peptidyl-prolyl cis-trans isomerase n=1 Tax=unclassified Microbacterium TaxID=2609290 RepID=UPI00214C4212|nr:MULTISPECIES: FKBP-type peptidyl-prolyl cis-trans isomerase [unclassified Microbacterium]MCR2785753.1 FKBP-type peptidyl-prolyl cis-trans isomerase [Microbacterium sp. zg.B96]WIM17264.1 FKBP-type peptidyl-prolyl cis-trans isomerase [Microbacterium sp. zg-B96]
MRRIPAIAAVIGLSTLALVGCTPASSGASCDRAASDASVLDLITVSGDTVELSAPVHADDTVFQDITVGEGPTVTSQAQDVVFDITIASGTTGETLVQSGTQVAPVSQWAEFYDGIAQMLDCATEGSLIVGAIAPDDLAPEAAQSLGLQEGDSAVFVIDLQKVYLGKADGADQYNDRRGMPSVVLAPDGTPGVIVPDAEAPDELVVQVLKKGDGEVVTGDQPVRVHYTGVTWDEREVFDSTWETGTSAALSLDQVVPGFAAALEGQTVGSQILAVIPPDQAYGDAGQGAVPPGATLVFVIDILGLDEVAE